ncbi:efflux transporter outer membrane subunit [Marinibacterium profundimaris]|uniref:efflux transporter outer membrane subunit n=1 Tax=Marinibacterium profundimaris TaxID=1679460 RepID=UPI000B5202CB|nr:efflux transporter outer membrane subunit [Marinibacterium profundimaris]
MRLPSLSLIAILAVAGCTVGPDYNRPATALSARFVGGDAATVGQVAADRWWLSYEDRLLSDLVTRGLAQNLDVMAATEAINQARAELRATGVNAQASGGIDAASRVSGGSEISGRRESSSAELGAAYVIDLFGGYRRSQQAAEANLVAAQADVETVRLAWLAELVAAYSDARYYQAALALTRETISNREETVEITRGEYEFGAATEYEVAQAEALLATARANLPEFAALFDANVYAIATLLNENAGPIMQAMQAGAPQLRTPPGGATGVPADLLRNRPDVRSAEADLAAATARIGVAEAELYPSLTLTGTVARASSASTWGFGPALSLPVFNQGALQANRNAAVSQARQAEIAWRASVTNAVEDVQVGASNLARYRQRATALRRAVEDYNRALTLAQENYRNGAITLLDLLDTDRATAQARISAASAVNASAQAWAKLKIATGAGAAAASGMPETTVTAQAATPVSGG